MRNMMTAAAAAAMGGLVVVATLGIVQAPAQKAAAPKARYQMDVSTATGFGAMDKGNGRGMGLGSALSMMRGGGNREVRSLELRLGSSLAPSGGGPHSDHFMPPGMDLGTSVPLATPEPAKPVDDREPVERDFKRPKGRMLIFWGCGAHAGPGQPVILDFAKMTQGQIPPGLFSARVPADRGPRQGNSRTYGYWPNSLGRQQSVSPQSSLLGEHRIAGNYSPEIKFALSHNFMAPLRAQAVEAGSVTNVSWNPVPSATGYYAHGIGFSGNGGGEGADIVWWTSASRQEFGGGLTDWLSPAVVQRLIGEKVVMPPSQTQCQIPAEVKSAGGQFMMLSLYAYGPEAAFAYPPRPANPKLAWNPEWTARVRYRSMTTKMVGMPGMDDSAADDRQGRDGQGRDGRTKPKKCRGGLGGMLGGLAGVGC